MRGSVAGKVAGWQVGRRETGRLEMILGYKRGRLVHENMRKLVTKEYEYLA